MQAMNWLIQDGVDQPLGHDAAPIPHPVSQRSQVGIAESTRMKAAQRFQQHLGRGVRIIFQPPRYVAPFAFERTLAVSPVARFPDPARMGGPRPFLLPQAGKPGREPVQAFTLKGPLLPR